MRKRTPHLFLAFLILLPAAAGAHARTEDGGSISGVVRDSAGAVVAEAELALLDGRQTLVSSEKADAQGRFRFAEVRSGNYVLVVNSKGFAERRLPVSVRKDDLEGVEVVLEVLPVREYVTVTAHAGLVEDLDAVAQPVNVVTEANIAERAKSVVAQVALEEAGVHLQRTSSTMAGIFVRGLTGDKVNVFVDGVRYSNSAARGGVNTFLDLIEPSSVQTVEILRGPNSAQFGSDAMGGSVQFFSRTPVYSLGDRRLRGDFGTFFNTADASVGTNQSVSYATRRFGMLVNLAERRMNRLRVGRALDSHAAVTRFLGLRSDVLGDNRLPDTAFTQYGGMVRLNWSPTTGSNFTLHYQRGQQDGGKRYDQLLGGDGNLIADLRNLMGDFLFFRYDKVKLGWFDSFSFGYSFNSQREERVNQGGNGNPRASINHEYERTRAQGLQVYINKQLGTRNNLLFGGDFYQDGIHAPSYGFNPVTRVSTLRRPRVPDQARYRSGGFYAQEVVELVPKKVRLTGNIRYSGAAYRSRAAFSPVVGGSRLWPNDSLSVSDVTFRGGIVVTPLSGFSLSAKASRGFRPPSMTDLGTLGLTGSGFEVAAPDLAGLGGTVGSTADTSAISTGRPVVQLNPETSLTYEFGAHFRNKHVDTDFAFFVNDISDLIAKQSLILPPGAVGLLLGGTPITAQNANGVVFVAAATSPVLVRANFGDARIRGFEHRLNWKVSRDWSAGTVWTYLRAHDKATSLPPNIEGGTPAPDGYLKIRYAPTKYRFWIEPYLHAAGRQSRLSTLDLSDRRTGADRSRSSIRNFFLNGATVRGLVGAGPDAVLGTGDDILLPTGETLLQVQDRVLGVGVNSAALFRAVPGYVTFNVRGGFHFRERHQVMFDVENLGDRNYRGISWGMDAPGRSISFRYSYRY